MRLFPKDRDLSQALEQIELAVRASDWGTPLEELELRLDQFLTRHMPWRSRSSVQNLVRAGFVYVDVSTPDQPAGCGAYSLERRPARRLRHGSRVLVVIPEELRAKTIARPPGAGACAELCVVHEDESVIVVDKPPFLAVHPSGRHLLDTLIQRVHAAYGSERLHRDARPRLCHRLDRETSGLVLVGKDPGSHADLMGQFERREVDKEYLAIVQGCPREDGGEVDLPIGPSRTSTIGLKMAVESDGQPARTAWRVLERLQGCSLVACVPYTGRQHQIRVHMDALGHPLVGDKLYGPGEHYFQKHADGELTASDLRALELPRHALHNAMLGFVSPRSGERVQVRCGLASDLEEFLESRRGQQ